MPKIADKNPIWFINQLTRGGINHSILCTDISVSNGIAASNETLHSTPLSLSLSFIYLWYNCGWILVKRSKGMNLRPVMNNWHWFLQGQMYRTQFKREHSWWNENSLDWINAVRSKIPQGKNWIFDLIATMRLIKISIDLKGIKWMNGNDTVIFQLAIVADCSCVRLV